MKLVDWRLEKGLTQAELARELSIHSQYLSKIERGAQTPGRVLAKRISDHSGGRVAVTELLYPETLERDAA